MGRGGARDSVLYVSLEHLLCKTPYEDITVEIRESCQWHKMQSASTGTIMAWEKVVQLKKLRGKQVRPRCREGSSTDPSGYQRIHRHWQCISYYTHKRER